MLLRAERSRKIVKTKKGEERGKGEGGRQGIIFKNIIALSSSSNKYNGKSISQTVKTSFFAAINIPLHMRVALFSVEEEVIEWCHISCGQPQKKGEEERKEGWSEDLISLVAL